jgi:hypothetical protein
MQRTEESSVCGIRVDTVDYRKGEFSFRKIFRKTLVRGVLVLDETKASRDGGTSNRPCHSEGSCSHP